MSRILVPPSRAALVAVRKTTASPPAKLFVEAPAARLVTALAMSYPSRSWWLLLRRSSLSDPAQRQRSVAGLVDARAARDAL